MTKLISDMYLVAALLAYGAEIKQVDVSNASRQKFEFAETLPFVWVVEGGFPIKLNNPTVEAVEAAFLSKKLLFPSSYPDALRQTKSVIHANK